MGTETAASPVEIAMERLRDYFAQQGPLAAAQEEHQKALAARDEAIPYSDSILEQPALQQALSQIRASGREKQAARCWMPPLWAQRKARQLDYSTRLSYLPRRSAILNPGLP